MRANLLLFAATLVLSACNSRVLFPPTKSTNLTKPMAGVPPQSAPVAAAPATPLTLTTAAKDLVSILAAPGDQFAPLLSADGTKLALEEPGVDGRVHLSVRTLKDLASSTVISAETVESRGAAWTPDGASLVYASGTPAAFAVVQSSSVARTAPTMILTPKQVGAGERVAVSPDGRTLCIEVGVPEGRSLARVKIDGSDFRLLFEGRAPSFSPDGRRLAFVRNVGGYDQVFTALFETAGEVTQLTRDAANHRAPKYAPNGRYIAFASNAGFERFSAQGGTVDKTWNIHAVRVDGSQPIALTEGAATSVQPSWSSDGKVYFASNAAGSFDIYALTPIGDVGRP